MKRYLALALAISTIAAATVSAQSSTAGWKQRIDRSTQATDPDPAGDVKFMAMGGGFHTANPQAAIFWNPKNTATGNYTLKATFAQNQRSSHPNYLGLIFGGKDLDGANQSYTYFTVAQNGTYLIKQRNGEMTKDIKGYTPNDAVKRPDATGKSVNALEVRVAGDTVSYVVNGTVVHTSPKSELGATDGIVGFRVNHVTEVQVDGFEVQKS